MSLEEMNNDFFDKINREIYVLGTNKYGLSLADWFIKRNYRFKGFINDYLSEQYFEGYAIYKSSHNFQDSHIVNCIIEGRTIEAENNIISLQPYSHTHYFDFLTKFPDELLEIDYLENEKLLQNQDINEIFALLADDRSKREFISVISFRQSKDIRYLSDFKFRIEEQYFEDFIGLNTNPVFVDGGGFDGKTTLKFIELYPQYEQIYYFEPSDIWFNASKKVLHDFGNITFYNFGLWEKKDQLKFDDTLGSASNLNAKGNVIVDVISLDEIITSRIDFIKLDIEGAEFNALKGAENLIKVYRPKLAVCVYHNSLDFIRIPKLLLTYHSDYKIYFRHYTQGVFESVMYFI